MSASRAIAIARTGHTRRTHFVTFDENPSRTDIIAQRFITLRGSERLGIVLLVSGLFLTAMGALASASTLLPMPVVAGVAGFVLAVPSLVIAVWNRRARAECDD